MSTQPISHKLPRFFEKTSLKSSYCTKIICGGIAQLGERLNGIQEVSGSIPLISTTTKNSYSQQLYEFLLYRNWGGGADSYTAAKRDFATRSGLIPRSALFDQKQLIEIYHCSVEVQAGLYSITDEQEKCLQSIIDQIELSIPKLGELHDQEQKIEAPEDGGMQFS